MVADRSRKLPSLRPGDPTRHLGSRRRPDVLLDRLRRPLSTLLAAEVRGHKTDRGKDAGGERRVKLGISQACYRWVTYPHLRRDSSAYLYGARPLSYLQSIRPPAADEPLTDYLMDRMAEVGIPGLYMTASWLRGRAGAEAFRRR